MREVDKTEAIFFIRSNFQEQNSLLHPWTKPKNNQKSDTLKEFIPYQSSQQVLSQQSTFGILRLPSAEILI